MKIRFQKDPIDRVSADILALGFCEEERPLRGDLGLIDWRLHGIISQAIIQFRLTGKTDEVTLLPSKQRLGSPWILLVGLGSALELGPTSAENYGRLVLERAYGLKARRCAIYYPFNLTRAPYNRDALRNLLSGLSQFASRCDDNTFIDELKLLIPSEKEEEVDLSNVMVNRLLAEHSLAATL